MHIRTIEPNDFPALRAFDPQPLPPLADGVLQMFTTWCCPVSFLATGKDDEIAGFALAMQSVDRVTVLLHYLVVRPDQRDRGIGHGLLAAVERAATAHGAGRVALFTSRAGGYYQPHGYHEAPDVVPTATQAYNLTQRGGRYFVKPLPAVAVSQERPAW